MDEEEEYCCRIKERHLCTLTLELIIHSYQHISGRSREDTAQIFTILSSELCDTLRVVEQRSNFLTVFPPTTDLNMLSVALHFHCISPKAVAFSARSEKSEMQPISR